MEVGNSIEFVDYDHGNKELWGIYLSNPLDLGGIEAFVNPPESLQYFECQNMFCQPNAGFI